MNDQIQVESVSTTAIATAGTLPCCIFRSAMIELNPT
jgi:hypothetical protein